MLPLQRDVHTVTPHYVTWGGNGDGGGVGCYHSNMMYIPSRRTMSRGAGMGMGVGWGVTTPT